MGMMQTPSLAKTNVQFWMIAIGGPFLMFQPHQPTKLTTNAFCLKIVPFMNQVVYVSWYNSSVGIGGQTSNRCNSWYVSESISVSKVSITVSFTLSNVVTIWPSSVSSISDMGDRGDSDVLEDWSSLGSKMGSGGGSNSWGISWDLGSIGVGGKSSNRNDWSSH